MASPPPSRHYGSSSNPPPPPTSTRDYIAGKAKEILATHDVTGITRLVASLCYGKEKEEEEDESSELLFESFADNFPNLLALKLLQAYRSTTTMARVRSHSLSLLDQLLTNLEASRIGLKTETLGDVKEHLNWCLVQQETSDQDFKLLARIVSRVSVDCFISYVPWEELCFFILSLHEDSKRTLLVFAELPNLLEYEFLIQFLENNLDVKISKGLFDRGCDEEEWCLALEAAFCLMLQVMNQERKDLVWDCVYAISSSVWEMVNVRGGGRGEDVVRRGILRLERKVRRDVTRFLDPEFKVVSRLVSMFKRIDGVGKDTVVAAEKIQDVLEENRRM